MANTPLIVGSAALSNGKVAVLLGDTDTTTISSNTYTTFDHLQVAILSPGGSAGLNDANALSFPSGGSPNGVFGDPTGGGAIAAMPGGGMAIETWGSSNNDYYVQILSNSGGVTVAPFVVGSANGPDGPFNTIGNIGAWTGGLVAAWNSSDETVTQFQRLTNTGATSGSTITLAPGTGAQDPDGTPPYTWEGSMAVDSQGDVIFSFAAGDVYTSTKYLEYNSANQLVGSGTLGEKEGSVAFVATPGGGFVTAYYTPTGAWNESLGRYPGFNLTIQTISSSGAVTTVKTVANAVGAGQQPSTNNLAVSSNGTFVFQESGQTAYDSYDLSTNTLTRNAFTLGDPLSTVPSANGSGQVYGAAVSGSDVEAETLLVCFAAGTRILTERGDVPVEQLTTADMAMTLSDGARAVRWIGRRRIDLTAHPRPETAAPIRIQRGAFADGVPHSDLLVSPDHAIFVDGMLICARQLINGTTIRQEVSCRSIEYFHVELDAHSILFAEGLPAESYLDTGNRGFFSNSGAPVILHPDLTDETIYPTREAASCAPFVWDAASVLPVWQSLADRASALGQPVAPPHTSTDPELHLLIAGRRIRPVSGGAGRATFVLPGGSTEVRLVSRASLPTYARPWLNDRRRLGVPVARIIMRHGSVVSEVPLDLPDFHEGWWPVELDGVSIRRWTNGEAVLPLPVLDGTAMLEVRLAGEMAYPVDCGAVVDRQVGFRAA